MSGGDAINLKCSTSCWIGLGVSLVLVGAFLAAVSFFCRRCCCNQFEWQGCQWHCCGLHCRRIKAPDADKKVAKCSPENDGASIASESETLDVDVDLESDFHKVPWDINAVV